MEGEERAEGMEPEQAANAVADVFSTNGKTGKVGKSSNPRLTAPWKKGLSVKNMSIIGTLFIASKQINVKGPKCMISALHFV